MTPPLHDYDGKMSPWERSLEKDRVELFAMVHGNIRKYLIPCKILFFAWYLPNLVSGVETDIALKELILTVEDLTQEDFQNFLVEIKYARLVISSD